jgi:hypothetical protein
VCSNCQYGRSHQYINTKTGGFAVTKGKYVFQIGVLEDGKVEVITAKDEVAKRLRPEEIGELLVGQEIEEAQTFPPMSFIRSSRCFWVCVGGHWYYFCW